MVVIYLRRLYTHTYRYVYIHLYIVVSCYKIIYIYNSNIIDTCINIWIFQGYFFNEDTSGQNKESDDLLSDCPALSAELDPPFRKINIVWAIVVEILLFVGVLYKYIIYKYICAKVLGLGPAPTLYNWLKKDVFFNSLN